MTATDELRRLLDERDEYYGTAGNKTWWGRPIDAQTGKPINVFHNFAQPMGEDRLYVELQLATPEQAIAATLGAEDTYTREDVESSFVHGYSLGCAPVDGSGAWDENAKELEAEMADLGWVRKDATLGGGRITAEQVHELIAPHLHARPTFDFGRHGAVWGADFQAIADELNATLGRKTTTRNTTRTVYGNKRPVCEVCGYGIGDRRWNYCPKCGARIVEADE